MRASADNERVMRERNALRSNDRNDAISHTSGVDSNLAASYRLPRLMDPSSSRIPGWEGSQQGSPSLMRAQTNRIVSRGRGEHNSEQTQRLPGVQALLGPDTQFNPVSPYSPRSQSYLPPFPQISSGYQYPETTVTAAGLQRENSNFWPNRSLPSSPFSDDHRTFTQPQQRLPIREDKRAESLPANSDRHQGGPAAIALKTEFEPPRSIRTNPDYRPPPTCIGKREIEGEGSCWVFADGTYCKTVVDGEPVNPSWGVTKAGKARKRLAQACLTCREKKIRCEPGFPKCTQCEKTGKICKRGSSHTSSAASSADSLPPHPLLRPPSSAASSPISVGDPYTPSRKRLRLMEQEAPMQDIEGETTDEAMSTRRSMDSYDKASERRDSSDSIPSREPLNRLHVSSPGAPPHMMNQIYLSVESDPYEIGPEITLHLLDLYFNHVNSITLNLFGRKTFTRWLTSGKRKCHEELIVLYSVLAAGSVFAPELSIGTRLLDIASRAIRRKPGNFSLSCIQARQLLAFCAFARGRRTEAWEYSGAALRGIASRKYTSEEGIHQGDEAELQHLPCGMTTTQIIECRRRTLWSAYTAEQYKSFFEDSPSAMQCRDIFTRLPCPDTLYDEDAIPEMPLFDNGVIDKRLTRSSATLGGLGYFAQIATLFSEVATHIHRSKWRAAEDYAFDYEDLYASLRERLCGWSNSLPPAFQYSVPNLANSNQIPSTGLLLSLHTMFHTTVLKLHRYARPACLGPALITRNILLARQSARTILNLLLKLNEIEHSTSTATFPGHALIAAFDVLSAGGSMAELPSLISAFLRAAHFLDELSNFWASAKHQRRLLQRRVEELAQIADGTGPGSLSADGQYWTVCEPLEVHAPKECDVIYGIERTLYFETLLREHA